MSEQDSEEVAEVATENNTEEEIPEKDEMEVPETEEVKTLDAQEWVPSDYRIYLFIFSENRREHELLEEEAVWYILLWI